MDIRKVGLTPAMRNEGLASTAEALNRGPKPDRPATVAAPAVTADVARKQQALVKFEKVAMQVLVESMLPKESKAIFGRGTAGNVWRSMLAERLAETVVESGRVKLLPADAARPPSATRQVTTTQEHAGTPGGMTAATWQTTINLEPHK